METIRITKILFVLVVSGRKFLMNNNSISILICIHSFARVSAMSVSPFSWNCHVPVSVSVSCSYLWFLGSGNFVIISCNGMVLVWNGRTTNRHVLYKNLKSGSCWTTLINALAKSALLWTCKFRGLSSGEDTFSTKGSIPRTYDQCISINKKPNQTGTQFWANVVSCKKSVFPIIKGYLWNYLLEI